MRDGKLEAVVTGMGAAEWHSRASTRPSVSIPRLAARGAAKCPNSGLPDPALLGSQLLAFTSHLPLCVPSLLRKSSAIKEGSTGPGLAHGPFSGQPDGTRRAALLSRRGPGLPTFWEEPWCLEGGWAWGVAVSARAPEACSGPACCFSACSGGRGAQPAPVSARLWAVYRAPDRAPLPEHWGWLRDGV